MSNFKQILCMAWTPPIKDWDEIPIDTYKFVYDEAKNRFEEHMSESESITNKSIKMLTSTATLFGFFIGFLSKKQPDTIFIIGLGIVYLVELILLYLLIAPKEIKWRGLAPKVIFLNDLDAADMKDKQSQFVYCTAIGIIQNNIDEMIEKNEGRVTYYRKAFILLILLIVATVGFVGWTIYHP